MPYKPKFCCECGEPIERVDWTLLTSRRFCQLCATEYRFAELIPRIAIAAGILFGILGLGTYLQRSEKPLHVATVNTTNTNKNAVNNAQVSTGANAQSFAKIQETNVAAAQPSSKSAVEAPKQNLNAQKAENQPSAAQETIYYCGAQTKKGTICTRRVKGGGRCWQHIGKPAMLPPEKLIAQR